MNNISSYVDVLRIGMNQPKKDKLKQYFTNASLSKFMASMMSYRNNEIDILDPGAGIGALSIACIEEIINSNSKPNIVRVTAYEIDGSLIPYLDKSMKQCMKLCEESGINFSYDIRHKDFIIDIISLGFNKQFSHIIINPPYSKINNSSTIAKLLLEENLDHTNIYSAFIAISQKILKPRGQMVFISPRSFCNGVYFESFRKNFLQSLLLKRIHIFNSRTTSFSDDDVLQENIIVYSIKEKIKKNIITVTTSSGPNDSNMMTKNFPSNLIIKSNDSKKFIHIISDESNKQISQIMDQLKTSLHDLNINISTGKIVDFRIKQMLRHKPTKNTIPLIQPHNIINGIIKYPANSKKHNYVVIAQKTYPLLLKLKNYVIIKRFSSNEEKKRISSAILSKNEYDYPLVGFENKINYFHMDDNDLNINIARGLSLFLNSSIVDQYFRQFNGHTQVNASDLQYLKYPTYDQLKSLGTKHHEINGNQNKIDTFMWKILFSNSNIMTKKQKINEAIDVLKQLDFPKEQQNIRSALTLLALLDLDQNNLWNMSKNPLLGVTQMMKYFEKKYNKKYAPNSRETVRRQTIHQFLDAGLIEINPDKPTRPTNSGKTVYRITKESLKLLKMYKTIGWDEQLSTYRLKQPSLKKNYEIKRKMNMIPLTTSSKTIISLSPGGQNPLIKKICNELGPRFAPGGILLYAGDAGKKFSNIGNNALKELGIDIDPHGKMPDVIIQHKDEWLLIIEAVTSHGPMDDKRRLELKKIFSKSKVGLVFITAFLNKETMRKYLKRISWESEVWIADSPSHMIHFDGIRFLGPYE